MAREPAVSRSVATVPSVVLYVLTHPWTVFVERWNWKAALLGSAFRGIAFAIPVGALTGKDAIESVWAEMLFRIAVSGFWGSLLQAFRAAQPAWLAGLFVALVLPAAAHALEFAVLRASHATHIRTGMTVSIVISIGSLVINWSLMRRGLLVTGEGSATLGADLRRVPSALAAIFRSVRRVKTS